MGGRHETGAAGWSRDADGVSYPPEPWRLEGTLYASLWLVPPAELPVACLPPGARPASLLGRATVGTAWAVYGPGGVLTYNEVLAAVRVRIGGRPAVTITHIWVDHPSSVAGGRALWSIPKQHAVFRVERGGGVDDAGFAASATDGRPIAALRFRRRAALPGRWRLRVRTAQRPVGDDAGAGATIARGEAVAAVELGAATWRLAPDGPLGFLSAREPVASARLVRMSLRFGGDGSR